MDATATTGAATMLPLAMDAPPPRQPEPAHDIATNQQIGEAALLALLKRRDPDRLLVTLFAPPSRRLALAALYAFGHELARVPEMASEPALGLIRLQWWREVTDGGRPRHEVASPLGAALDASLLDAGDLRALLAAREEELAGPLLGVAAWQAHIAATEGALAAAAGRALGATAPERTRLAALGTAYGVARLLLRMEPSARAEAAELATWGRRQLASAGGRLPYPLLGAGLIGTLARRDLHRLARNRLEAGFSPRGLGDRLAVFAAAAIGRV